MQHVETWSQVATGGASCDARAHARLYIGRNLNAVSQQSCEKRKKKKQVGEEREADDGDGRERERERGEAREEEV